MNDRLFGFPLVLWGVLCLVIGIVWLVVWPGSKADAATGARFVILRWFHALVWLLLAAAAFLGGFGVLGGITTARILALAALLTYFVYIGTLLTTR